MAYFNHIDINGVGATRFDELKTAIRSSQLNFKPTWGISTLRHTTSTTGAGASVGETGGEFRLQSGTANNGLAQIQTSKRGQYQAGAMGQAGIGVRVPTQPSSTAFVEWGYTDFQNGYGYGYDATGLYVFYCTGGSQTKIYSTSWNGDPLDGTGASGLTLDLSKGVVCQIDFVWYGYGDIDFCFYPYNTLTGDIQKVTGHHLRIDSAVSTIDPNQPLTFRVGNGASGTTNTNLYIGGHQFSILDGYSSPQLRYCTELLTNYTTATNTNWQPLIAVRKVATFNGRNNSVNVSIDGYEVAADGEMETRLTIAGTTSNLSWGTPTGWVSTETACETKVTGGTALTTSADGYPKAYSFVSSANKAAAVISEDIQIKLGATIECILWVRRLSATGAIVVKHANIHWIEEW